jgi:hypothetical protein
VAVEGVGAVGVLDAEEPVEQLLLTLTTGIPVRPSW